jgi:hypothetical protein
MYYLFRDGDRLRDALRDTLPLERPKASEIFRRRREVIYASVYGVNAVFPPRGARHCLTRPPEYCRKSCGLVLTRAERREPTFLERL